MSSAGNQKSYAVLVAEAMARNAYAAWAVHHLCGSGDSQVPRGQQSRQARKGGDRDGKSHIKQQGPRREGKPSCDGEPKRSGARCDARREPLPDGKLRESRRTRRNKGRRSTTRVQAIKTFWSFAAPIMEEADSIMEDAFPITASSPGSTTMSPQSLAPAQAVEVDSLTMAFDLMDIDTPASSSVPDHLPEPMDVDLPEVITDQGSLLTPPGTDLLAPAVTRDGGRNPGRSARPVVAEASSSSLPPSRVEDGRPQGKATKKNNKTKKPTNPHMQDCLDGFQQTYPDIYGRKPQPPRVKAVSQENKRPSENYTTVVSPSDGTAARLNRALRAPVQAPPQRHSPTDPHSSYRPSFSISASLLDSHYGRIRY